MQKVSFKTSIYLGVGALDRLEKLENKRIFIVTDPYMITSGMINHISRRLNPSNEQYIFSNIVPDPPLEIVTEGVKELGLFKADVIIALGGGSAIDAAKAMMFFARKVFNLADTPLIAIPTTSGTGSEVTSFSVISDHKKNIKHALVSDDMLPAEAILDAELVKSLPTSITADTGMDVLTHAIEAFVSINANDISDALAEKSIKLVFDYLPRVVKQGDDLPARQKMHAASCMAGMAFNVTSLGLNHGIAHVAGAKFKIAHGRINAILLPHIIEFNADYQIGNVYSKPNAAAERYAVIARSLGLSAFTVRGGVRSLVLAIRQLMKQIHIPQTLRECGVTPGDMEIFREEIAAEALRDRCTESNPRAAVKQDIIEILDKVY
jgi:1-propanol dehydrogenase